jgi:hypothetical protein
MEKTTFCTALVFLLSVPFLAGTPSDNPRVLGPVVLRELAIRDGTVSLRVDSGGCTDKASIKATVRKEAGLTEMAPHYVLTFDRVSADDCKAMLLDGVALEYDIARDLRITGLYTLSVTNWVSPRSGDYVVEEVSLKKALITATARAIEMELRGYEGKLKTAESGVGPAGNAEKFRKSISELKGALEKYKNLDPADYSLGTPQGDPVSALEGQQEYGPVQPAPERTVTVVVKEPYKEGSTPDVEGMSRSGPFFHLAGIAGNDYSRLKPGTRYELMLYLVYKREYFGAVSDYYVYVADFK